MNLQNWKKLRVTAILLLALSLPFLSIPAAWAVARDKANVSPGKVPSADKNPIFRNHYLGNSSFMVKLEYPRSFILQETVGDLAFTVTIAPDESRRRIDIYVPPEFKVNTGSSYVWTNITNNYANIGITKAGSFDDAAPSWYKVSITSPVTGPGNYSIRVFNVTAPSIVGLYFFKIFTDRTSIGANNFPSVVVSADPNPAYVSGTVIYGGRLPEYVYGDPIALDASSGEGGKVCATGITTEGRIVIGQAFFNASAKGQYTLYGLAPGRYTLNATAARYAPGELPYPIFLKAGQSMEGLDIFLERSSTFTVIGLSRRGGMPEPWGWIYVNRTDLPDNRGPKNVTFEIIDSWNLTVIIRNETTVPTETYREFRYDGSKDKDGHIPQDSAGYVAGIGPGRYYIRLWVNGYIQPSIINDWLYTNDCTVIFTRNEQDRRIILPLEKTGTIWVTVHFRNSTYVQQSAVPFSGRVTLNAYDADDTLRATNSTVVSTGNMAATVELTGFVDTRRDYGMPPSTYNITASFQGYIQPVEHRTTIGAGRHETSFHMYLLGRLNLTVFSINWQRPFKSVDWKYPNSTITVEIRDAYGLEVYSTYRRTPLPPQFNSSITFPDVKGLDDGTYSVHVFTYGYIQERAIFFSVKRGEMADISAYVVTGGEIKITLVFQKQKILSSIDTYRNYWNSSAAVPVRFEIYDSRMQFVGASATYILGADTRTFFPDITVAGFKAYYGNAATRWINYYDTTDGSIQRDYGLVSDWYTLEVYVPGYYQKSDPVIEVRRGGETSVIILLERMAHLYGKVHTFNTYFENYTRISWVNVDAIGEEMTIRSCTMDGFFEAWLVPGSYLVVFSLPEYQVRSVRLVMPDGSDVQVDYQLLPLGFKP
jgi:hypothetical protein